MKIGKRQIVVKLQHIKDGKDNLFIRPSIGTKSSKDLTTQDLEAAINLFKNILLAQKKVKEAKGDDNVKAGGK